MDYSRLKRILKSSFVKDSFWAVFGNGLGSFLMLLAGILIARVLGKDLYGEYGMVKTTMFYIALFSTFALGDTSTKFVAEYLQKDKSLVKSIIRDAFRITLATSGTMFLLLMIFANQLADYINAPQMASSFRFLGVIIVARAVNTIGAGVLGGFKDYKRLGLNNVVAGIIMIGLAWPLSKYYGLNGSLWALLISQIVLCILNLFEATKNIRQIKTHRCVNVVRKLLNFSYPFAMTELVYTVSGWGINLILAKYASLGDLGMVSACQQWNSIILFMPGLLGNVILSYLSLSPNDANYHSKIITRMVVVNFVCTLIPLCIVALFSKAIESYYGLSFIGLSRVLTVSIIGTIFTCVARVFQTNLISEGRRWAAFFIRSSYNLLSLIVLYIVLRLTGGQNAAMNRVVISLGLSILGFILYLVDYKIHCCKGVRPLSNL